MTRHNDVDLNALTDEQQAVADAIAGGPRGSLRGPFVPWLLSPEMADHAQQLGGFLRYRTSLPDRLKELAILFTARHWDAEFEWYAHAPMAMEAGLSRSVVDAIAAGREPDFDERDEALIYTFCREIYETKRVSNETNNQVAVLFGQRGVAELVGVLGYYVLVSMTLNAFEVEAPDDGVVPPLQPTSSAAPTDN